MNHKISHVATIKEGTKRALLKNCPHHVWEGRICVKSCVISLRHLRIRFVQHMAIIRSI